jgi:hypothetical protein
VRKRKNETANPQNNTFASSDTQTETSACKRVVLFANAPEKNRHYDMDWLTWIILLTKQGKPKTLE